MSAIRSCFGFTEFSAQSRFRLASLFSTLSTFSTVATTSALCRSLKAATLVLTMGAGVTHAAMVIDFESDDSGALSPGDIVTDTTINGVTLSVFNQGNAGNRRKGATPGAGIPDAGDPLPPMFLENLNQGNRELILFNADCSGSSCSGQDPDLAVPGQGNILIISEENDTSDPDDSRFGGTIVFEFSQPVVSLNTVVVDVDENDPGDNFAAAYYQGQYVGRFGFTTEGQLNNNLQAAGFEGLIDVLIINLESSGGIASLEFTPVPVPAALWLMGAALLGLASAKRFKG